MTGPGGSASDDVSVTAQTDQLGITRAEFRADQAQWRIDGTASILDNNIITVFLGNGTSGVEIGSAQVDPVDGTFDVRVKGSPVSPGTATVVTVQSSRGGLTTTTFTQK